MKAADQCRDDVAVSRVVVVARAIQVGGHDAAVVHTMAVAKLAVVAFAEFDASDLGDGIWLVGGFERAGEQSVFGHGLGRQLGVDTAAAQKQQLLHAVAKRRLNHVGLDHQVLVDEVGRVGVVGVDTAYLGGGQVDLVWAFGFEEGSDGGLVGQVKLGVGTGDDAFCRVAMCQQASHDG